MAVAKVEKAISPQVTRQEVVGGGGYIPRLRPQTRPNFINCVSSRFVLTEHLFAKFLKAVNRKLG